jgi:3-oxoacyl-[acyl-carrier-protein] synthase-1/3-oxoacyl-[acyl-carrier-protein] synthase II
MTFAAAITGLGCISAAGASLPRMMAALYAGERRCAPPRAFAADLAAPYPVFEVTAPLEPPPNLPLPAAPTRTNRLALAAVLEACAQSGLGLSQLPQLRVGVCLGTTVGCTLNDEVFYRNFKQGTLPDPQPVARYLANNPALFIKQTLGLAGPAATVANACSSGTDAIGLARSWLRAGWCDVAIAGGADELSRIPYLGFAHLLITSPAPCRPFDQNRQGLNLGEGAGVVILETHESAARRGAAVLAEVIGYGSASDAHHPTAPHPEGKGLRRALGFALREAGAAPEEIGFINAHGTSTPDNDRIEGRVLADLFSPTTSIVSTKAYTGHTLGAAGGIEAALTVQALLDQRLPATAGFSEPDPDCAITPTTANTPLSARLAISDSLAFGGNNAALVFRRA